MLSIKRCLLKVGSVAISKDSGGVRFLLFHEVKKSQMKVFESVIRYVGETCGFIKPEEYDHYREDSKVHYIVSFDDGFASELKVTREILDPLGIKAIFFVCPGFVGLQGDMAARFTKGPMRRSDIVQMTPGLQPLAWEDLVYLAANGHMIGSHGMNHARLSELRSEEDLTTEILSSGDELEKRLGSAINWFAYPFGDIKSIDSPSLNMIAKRYKYCCSGLRGINTAATHRMCLLRENIDFDKPLDDLKRIAIGGIDIFYHFKRQRLLDMAKSCP